MKLISLTCGVCQMVPYIAEACWTLYRPALEKDSFFSKGQLNESVLFVGDCIRRLAKDNWLKQNRAWVRCRRYHKTQHNSIIKII